MKDTREVYADKESAMQRLRNNGIQIDTSNKVVIIPPVGNPHQVGIKLWGAIDYLQRFAGYSWGRAVR